MSTLRDRRSKAIRRTASLKVASKSTRSHCSETGRPRLTSWRTVVEIRWMCVSIRSICSTVPLSAPPRFNICTIEEMLESGLPTSCAIPAAICPIATIFCFSHICARIRSTLAASSSSRNITLLKLSPSSVSLFGQEIR